MALKFCQSFQAMPLVKEHAMFQSVILKRSSSKQLLILAEVQLHLVEKDLAPLHLLLLLSRTSHQHQNPQTYDYLIE